MYAKVLLTTHCARPSFIGPLDLADIVTHISQSVSVLNITLYGNIHEHYDNILINKYQGLITCKRLTPLQPCPICPRCRLERANSYWQEGKCPLTNKVVIISLRGRWHEGHKRRPWSYAGWHPLEELFDIKANCIKVVTPAPKMLCQASTAKEMEYWFKPVRTHI